MTKGGGGFLAPKAIANRIKSKGLQKLRWYCQLCSKQCRDENGMKCHMSSEGHLRMMRVFSENSGRILNEFSEAFLNGYLKTLSHRHGTKRTSANKVYQEYIADKDHVHMNSTIWSTLSGLCKYLGKEGKCIVEETETGWFIQYIDRDPKTLERQAQRAAKEKSELDDEERNRLLIQSQMAAGASKLSNMEESNNMDTSHTFERQENMPKIELSLAANVIGEKQQKMHTLKPMVNIFNVEDDIQESTTTSTTLLSNLNQLALPTIERIKREDEARKQKEMDILDQKERKDYWLCEGLTVKIMNKTVGGGKYYKQKGEVVKVIDQYVADVKVEGMAILRLDQDDVETVLPKVGNIVMIVNGRGRGCRATLVEIYEADFNCTIRVEEGPLAGKEIHKVEYEDVCKYTS